MTPRMVGRAHALDDRVARELDDPEVAVFLQCTSPVREPSDIDAAVQKLLESGADSLFSACEDRSHIWILDEGQPRSMSYDFGARRREQDMPPQYRENGSIYVFRPSVLRSEGNRLGGGSRSTRWVSGARSSSTPPRTPSSCRGS